MLSTKRLAGLALEDRAFTLALKPRVDITTSPNRCISGPTKMNYVLQDLKILLLTIKSSKSHTSSKTLAIFKWYVEIY